MLQGEEGVMQEHARAGVAHHLADLLTFLGLIAVDGAPGAGGFRCPIRAVLDTLMGISFQFKAILA
jgi:hypothetical protein